MFQKNLNIFGKNRIKDKIFETHQKDFHNSKKIKNNLLDQTDVGTKISKTQNNNHNLNNLLIKRRITDFQGIEHNKRPRLVKKCGELNIYMDNVPKHKRRLLSDIFNTILDMKWRWHLVIFLWSFIVSWFIFATIWYMIGKLVFFKRLIIKFKLQFICLFKNLDFIIFNNLVKISFKEFVQKNIFFFKVSSLIIYMFLCLTSNTVLIIKI